MGEITCELLHDRYNMKDLLILPERYYDVKVKSQEKALSIVKIHKRPQDHCAAPKEMLRAWYLGAGF